MKINSVQLHIGPGHTVGYDICDDTLHLYVDEYVLTHAPANVLVKLIEEGHTTFGISGFCDDVDNDEAN